MKKIIVLCTIILSSLAVQKGYAQVGFGTNKPDKSAVVDIVSTKRGLLIPRIDIPDVNAADPVTNPATSLLVYNSNTTSGVGFYYWDGTKWVRFTSSATEKTYTATEGDNVSITTTVSGNNTDFKISVKGGTAENQFLVTKKDANGNLVSEWVGVDDLKEVIKAENGITYDSASNTLRLGGDLTTNTTITTDPSGKTLAIKGLESLNKASFDPTAKEVVIMGADGILQKVSPKVLVEDAIAEGISGETLTSTGSILVTNGAGAVLTNTTIDIADGGIKSSHLSVGSISTTHIIGGADNTIMVTSGTTVMWVDKEDYIKGIQSVTVVADGNNTTVSATTSGNTTTYQVNVATASGTTLGLVKEAASNAEVTITSDGTLALNKGNIQLNGDVTGSLSNTTISSLQGKTVSATNPTTGQVLTYNGSEWTPVTPTVDASNVSGTGDLTASPASVLEVVSGTGAVLTDAEVKIKAGTNGSILVTNDAGVVTWTNTLPEGTTLSVTNIVSTATGVITIKDGQATVTAVADILSGTLSATNGLTLSGTVVKLGGSLTEPTTLVTSDANTLSIQGLKAVKETQPRSILVVENDGKLRTAVHDLSFDITQDEDLGNNGIYSPYVPEVIVTVTLGSSDIDLTLPSASVANGQVISIKILNTNEPDGYLNIKDGTETLAYGALPYQAWIVKSDGTQWRVVGTQ